MHWSSKIRQKKAQQGGGRLAFVLLFALVSGVALLLSEGTEPAERAVLLRFWTLFAAGVFAVSAPHVLLPDPHLYLLQHFNPPPGALLLHQLRRWGPVIFLLGVPCLLLAYFDPGRFGAHLGAKSRHLLENLFVVIGIGLFSFGLYATMGRRSQEWQEGIRGQRYRRIAEHSTTGRPPIPYGLVPAVNATGWIFIVGALAVVTGAYVEGALAPGWGWVPGLALLAWAAGKLVRLRPQYDRHFYATNAFYSEIFRSAGGVRVAEREPIPYQAVYWVPRRWKPHAWAGLRQLDRRMPLGRMILMGHLFLWVLFLRDAGAGIIAAYLLLFSAIKNAAVYLLAGPPLAPEPFQVLQQSPGDWTVTRFFVNLRWTMPLLLSLSAVAFLDPAFRFAEALLWTGLDLVLALLSAALVTMLAEGRYRRRYA